MWILFKYYLISFFLFLFAHSRYVSIVFHAVVTNVFDYSHTLIISWDHLKNLGRFSICSLNVRGLVDNNKRRETFLYLRRKLFSVYMLQEIHCSKETVDLWCAEWGYRAIFSSFSSQKAGVCFLFNNNFSFEITKQSIDPLCRFIILDLKTDDRVLTLLNIYGPNQDDPDFFKRVANLMLDFKCEDIIAGGDFNLVLDIEKDKKGGNAKTHTRSSEQLITIMQNLDLNDGWRERNPDGSRFTWRKRKPEIHCWLDFFLISSSLLGNVTNANILPSFKTDHSMVSIHLKTNQNPRGPGFWKFNTSLLSDIDYINVIKETIKNVVNLYKYDASVNEILLWDMIKLEVRTSSIAFSKKKNKKLKCKEKILEDEINHLEERLEKEYEEGTLEELNNKQNELEKITEYHTKGAMLRGKIRWYKEGERNTKYFLGLEKRHFNRKRITKLDIGDEEITSDKSILQETRAFYENLYSSNITLTQDTTSEKFFDRVDEKLIKLEDQQWEPCEGILTKKECLQALKTMEKGKSPGCDGFPAEFYQVFWIDITDLYVNAINKAYREGILSITQRRGIISLLPKGRKSPLLLKNWRPITLLNCDYKIAAKGIAFRVKNVLPKIDNNDQTGFLKNIHWREYSPY